MAHVPNSTTATAESAATLLLVAEDPTTCEQVIRIVERHWNILCATDSTEALELMAKHAPDVVLCDLPVAKSLSLLAQLRKQEEGNTPVILLCNREDETELEAHEGEANDYVVKPLLPKQLVTRIRAQLELSSARNRYRLAMRATRDAIWDWDLVTNEVLWNEVLHFEFGYSRGDLVTSATWWYEHIHPDDRERVVKGIHAVIDGGGELWSDEYRFRKCDGTYRQFLDRGCVVRNAAGKPLRMLGAMSDVTELRRTLAALKESETYFRNLADTAPAMLWTTDANGRCTYLSQRWSEYTGRSGELDLGLGWLENIHRDDRSSAEVAFLRANAEKKPFSFEYRLRRRDGQYRWAVDQGAPRADAAGEFAGFIGAVVDVHDLRHAEKTVHEVQRRFERSAKATDLGVWYCDLPFADLDWNDEVKNHFWLPRETKVNIDLFYERIHPQDRERTREAIARSIRENGHYDIEYRTIRPSDESQFKWIRAIGWTDYDPAGNPIRFDGITLDITEQKKAREELEASNAELARFAFIASHDLKEPLRVISNYAQMFKLRYRGKLDANADTYLGHIVAGVDRMYALIGDVLSYSRAGAADPKLVDTDCGAVVAQAIENLGQAVADSGAQIEVAPLPTVKAEPGQYVQLFQNLIGNAIKYRGDHPPKVRIFAERRDGATTISVQDNGIGIAPEYFEKIFVLFQRLHHMNEYSGTGIGLALCKKIVERHGGRIWVESEPGRGSTFSFTTEVADPKKP